LVVFVFFSFSFEAALIDISMFGAITLIKHFLVVPRKVVRNDRRGDDTDWG
jgi:hypothetical protein